MKIDDIVNIKCYTEGKFWKGKVYDMTDYHGLFEEPLFYIEGINQKSHAVVFENDCVFRNGEYWEI